MNDVALTERQKIEALEQYIAQLPQVDLQTSHVLMGGIYARTIYIPAGATLTGAVHRKDHVNVMVGDIMVSTDEGMTRLTGHHVIPTKAGMKRAGYALADTVWTTLCKTDETDISRIEADLVEEPERLQTRQALSGPQTLRIE